jgi:hypothetical protein
MQPLFLGALAPCGLFVGAALAAALVVRTTRTRQRTAAHP